MKEREKFGTRLGFILVSAGCAIGLGNVWKFPYICGKYGGAAFIVMYLVFLLILGFPILISEFAIGRGSQKGPSQAYKTLEPRGTSWHHFKWMSILGSYLLMMFYTMVAGWMLYYAYMEMSGKLRGLGKAGVSAAFDQMKQSPGTMMLWMAITIVISFGACALGLNNGVEKITKVMMTLLILLMIVLVLHSVTMKNAFAGVRFYLVPDFALVKKEGIGTAVFAAMTHAFFTLSIGIGAMEIFGSYLDKDRTLLGDATSVIVLDTLVALMAGFIIIPACFAFGVQPDAGPSLLFITLPNVFNSMAGGRIWGAAFFVFMSFAALSTVIAVFEEIISFFTDTEKFTRKQAVRINIPLIFVLSIPAVLGFNLLAHIQPMGVGSNIMDIEDFLVSYNLLPLGSMIAVLFCVKKNGWGFDYFLQEVNTGEGKHFPKGIRFYMTYILPLIITVVYLKGYYDTFAPMGKQTLIGWMCVAVLFIVLIFTVAFRTGRKRTVS